LSFSLKREFSSLVPHQSGHTRTALHWSLPVLVFPDEGVQHFIQAQLTTSRLTSSRPVTYQSPHTGQISLPV